MLFISSTYGLVFQRCIADFSLLTRVCSTFYTILLKYMYMYTLVINRCWNDVVLMRNKRYAKDIAPISLMTIAYY